MNAIRLIKEREATRRDSANFTRLYNIVVPMRNGEARIDTYAVKTRNKRTGELAIKKVMRMRTDRKRYWARDIITNNLMNTHSVNWCNEPFGRKHRSIVCSIDDTIGVWGYLDYSYGKVLDLHGEWLNDFKGTKYEHCGFAENIYIKFRDYVEVWNNNHATEFLARSNLYRIVKPSFVNALAKDRALFAFFRSHIGEIRKTSMSGKPYAAYGVKEILHAYRHGVSLAEAQLVVAFGNEARHMRNLPKCVDREELRKYLARSKRTCAEYDWYCYQLSRLGVDINAYGYMFPSRRTWGKVERDMDALEAAERAEAQRERKREEARERRERKERLARWKRICGYLDTMDGREIGGYEISVPHSAKDLVAEGNAMRNCIGTYGSDFKDGETILLFFRKDGKPFMDAEISPSTFAVKQVYRFANSAASLADKRLVRRLAREIETEYRKAA